MAFLILLLYCIEFSVLRENGCILADLVRTQHTNTSLYQDYTWSIFNPKRGCMSKSRLLLIPVRILYLWCSVYVASVIMTGIMTYWCVACELDLPRYSHFLSKPRIQCSRVAVLKKPSTSNAAGATDRILISRIE